MTTACAIIWQMSNTQNIAAEMARHLPPPLAALLEAAGEAAARTDTSLYMVGGAVRDIMLGLPVLDLDLVAEDDAPTLAKQLADDSGARLTIHPRFGTANLTGEGWEVDITTARSETYPHPGALPQVKPGNIEDDLARRDFTINAIAVRLEPRRYGEVIDLHQGEEDLKKGLIRILHDRSFSDDATRMWRAVRYAGRLGFQIEKQTLALLKQDIDMLNTVSGDRIRYELECVLKEECPEDILQLATKLGILQRLHPKLETEPHIMKTWFQDARGLYGPQPPPPQIYLALLAYPLTPTEAEELIAYLNPRKQTTREIRDTIEIKRLEALADSAATPSHIYSALHGRSPTAITAGLIAAPTPTAEANIRLYRDKLRYVKTALGGADLKRMGIANGPRIKYTLTRLMKARLDGEATTKDEEVALVEGWVNPPPTPPA